MLIPGRERHQEGTGRRRAIPRATAAGGRGTVRGRQLWRDCGDRSSTPSSSATRVARSPAPSRDRRGLVRAGVAMGRCSWTRSARPRAPCRVKLLRVLEESGGVARGRRARRQPRARESWPPATSISSARLRCQSLPSGSLLPLECHRHRRSAAARAAARTFPCS